MDVDIHAALLQLFAFLPPRYQTLATSLLSLSIAAVPLFALVAMTVKPILGVPKDSDSALKRFAFWVVQHVIDNAALNTQKVSDKKTQAAHAGELAAKDRLIGSNLSVITSQERELQASDALIQRQAAALKNSVPLVADES